MAMLMPVSMNTRKDPFINGISSQVDTEKAQKEQEAAFLIGQLRSSEKLRSLEETKSKGKYPQRNANRQDEGRGNCAFIDDDDGKIQGNAVANPLTLSQLASFVSDLRATYATPATTNEWLWLDQYIATDTFSRAFHLHNCLADIRLAYDVTTSLTDDASGQLEGVVQALSRPRVQITAWTNQMQELKELLTLPEFMGLVSAHDLLAGQMSAENEDDFNLERPMSTTDLATLPQPIAEEIVVSRAAAGLQHSTPTPANSPPEDKYSITSDVPGCYANFRKTPSGNLIKTVVLHKGDEPLGATVRNEGNSVVVGRIVIGGIAYKTGLLKEGDEILTVNSIEMPGKDVNTVSEILTRMKGTLTFEVSPIDDMTTLISDKKDIIIDLESLRRSSEHHLRALFTYRPEDDLYIPCREIGLSFERGDILHVINTHDPNWWQAYRDKIESPQASTSPSETGLAGLIPSPDLQRQREVMRNLLNTRQQQQQQRIMREQTARHSPDHVTVSNLCAQRKEKRPSSATGKKKKRGLWKKAVKNSYCPSDIEDTYLQQCLTYEAVELYTQNAMSKRPIVFIGPLQVGRHDLLLRVIQSDIDRFAPVVPHTTRIPTTGEINGKDYHFVSKQDFESLRNSGQFIEFGVYEKNLYGTSKSAIRSVQETGRICVLSLQPESIASIRSSGYFPYVIFISPPRGIDAMRSLVNKLSQFNHPTTNDELLRTMERGRQMEIHNGHFFDKVLVNTEPDQTLREILSCIRRLEQEPQWVAKEWLTNSNPAMGIAPAISSPGLNGFTG